MLFSFSGFTQNSITFYSLTITDSITTPTFNATQLNIGTLFVTNIVYPFFGPISTNYTVVSSNNIIAINGTNTLITLENGTNSVTSGRTVTFIIAGQYASAVITNANGVQVVNEFPNLSKTITNGQRLVLSWDGTNWL